MNSFLDTFLIIATVLFGIYFVLKIFIALRIARQRTDYAKRGITGIDGIEGEDFVELVSEIFKAQDYSIRNITSDDSDADIIISKNNINTVVLALRHIKNLNWQIVDLALKAQKAYSCQSAIVITNIGFTRMARKYAAENNITLYGRAELTEMYIKARKIIEADNN